MPYILYNPIGMCDAREEKELFPKQKKVFENVRHRAFPYIERTHEKVQRKQYIQTHFRRKIVLFLKLNIFYSINKCVNVKMH